MARARRQASGEGAGASGALIAYYRVSTDQQGRSGLGLDAQKAAVARLVEGRPGARLIAEFQEVESGKRADRPQLRAALVACRARHAVLVVAKLDRLARNTAFLLSVAEGVGDGGVVFCDLPQLPPGPMGRFFLTLMAAVAELEAGLISQRTKAALAARKAQGKTLGGPRVVQRCARTIAAAAAARAANAAEVVADVIPYIHAAQAAGATSLRQIAAALMARGVRTPFGGERWTATQVARVLARHTQELP